VTPVSTALALVTLAAWAVLALLGLRTKRAILRLDGPPAANPLPAVTVVVPCRNEEVGVEPAVRSLLAQDLPDLRVVAVNDRSTDATGAILDRLAAGDPRLEVVHVADLPEGWLGKNHACATGARASTGEWILFTDGDVVFAPDAVRRALGTALALRLGHLTLVPRFVAPGFGERAFVTAFASLLAPVGRVWDLPRAGTRAFFGVGAFNLVRRDAYERVGGHRRIAMEVVDDLKLGLLLRRGGVPQGVGDGTGLLSVRWQHGLLPSVLGLVKNAFAAVEYRIGIALAGVAACLLLGAAPLALALFAPAPAARIAAAAALAISALHHAETARRLARGSGAEGLLFPACALALSGVVLGSVAATWLRGGVVWRGTHYPIERIRAGCLRDAELPASAAAGWPDPEHAPPPGARLR